MTYSPQKPQPWTQQPHLNVGLDWDNPLLRAIDPVGVWSPIGPGVTRDDGISYYEAANPIMNHVDGKLLTPSNATSMFASGVSPVGSVTPLLPGYEKWAGGHTIHTSASGNNQFFDSGLVPDSSWRFMLWVEVISTYSEGENYAHGVHDGTRRFYASLNGNPSTAPFCAWGSNVFYPPAVFYPQPGEVHVMAMVVDRSNALRAFLDERLLGTIASVSWSGGASTRTFYVGRRTRNQASGVGIQDGAAHGTLLLIAGKGVPSDEQIIELQRNPWQIFQPRSQARWRPNVLVSALQTVEAAWSQFYSIMGTVATSIAAAFNIRGSVERSVVASYNVRGNVETAITATYPILGLVQRDMVSAAYNVQGLVQQSLAANYDIRGSVTRDVAVASYPIRGLVERTFVPASYVIRGSVDTSMAASYNVRGMVDLNIVQNYAVRGLVESSLLASYGIRTMVERDLIVASYEVQAQGQVTMSFGGAYLIRGYVERTVADANYNVRGAVETGLSANYTVRNEVSKNLVAAYNVNGMVERSITASYLVEFARYPVEPVSITASYDIRAEVEMTVVKAEYLVGVDAGSGGGGLGPQHIPVIAQAVAALVQPNTPQDIRDALTLPATRPADPGSIDDQLATGRDLTIAMS